jgi:hypothetical protein
MNTETKVKRPVRTVLIIVTFVFAVAAVAWLSVKIVNKLPNSFASLASLAESVKEYESTNGSDSNSDSDGKMNDMLIVTSDTNVVVAGEQVRLAWTEATTPGSYVFSYGCTDGVAIDLKDGSGERSISCDTNYNLGDVNTVSLSIDSEKERYVDIPYKLAFLATNDTEPRASDDAILTVVNNRIQSGKTEETEVTSPAVTPEPEFVVTPPVVNPTPATPTSPSNPTAPTTPTKPTYTQEFTYEIPVSNPNGKADLSTKFLNIGKIVNNKFVAQAVDNDSSGAVQFEVKNLGTKTSEKWSYTVSLPSGDTYESPTQNALKPNERAVITIGFGESDETSYTFNVSAKVSGDVSNANNTFKKSVKFTE